MLDLQSWLPIDANIQTDEFSETLELYLEFVVAAYMESTISNQIKKYILLKGFA